MTVQAVDLLFLATGLFAAACMWQPNRLHYDGYHVIAWAFLILCMIPLLIHLLTGDLRSPWHAWRQMLYLTSAWLVFQMSRTKAFNLLESKKFAYLLAVVAALYTTYALVQAYDVRFLAGERLFPVWSEQVARFPGPLMQPNWESIFLAIVTIFLLFHASHAHHSLNFGRFLAIIPCTGMLLTASRSGLVSFALGCFFLYWTAMERKQYLRLMVICIIPALAISMLIQNTVPQVGPSMVNRIEAGGFLDRIAIWDMCWQIFRHHPLLGIGWGNLPAYAMDGMVAAYQAYPWLAQAPIMAGGHAWAHNLLFQFFVEGGLLGGAAMLFLLWTVCVKAFQIFGHLSPAPQGVMLGGVLSLMLLAHGMLSVSMMQPFFQVLLALFLAALFPARRDLNA